MVRIATAAGVSHQLITYHFGGKRGLFDALNQDWVDRSDEMISEPEPLVQVMRDFVIRALNDEAWTRTLIREALDGGFPIADRRVAGIIELLEKTRIRQKQGEIDASVDVGALGLAMMAACMAPVILPAFARAFVRMDRSSEEFAQLYADQLGMIVASLGEPAPHPPSS